MSRQSEAGGGGDLVPGEDPGDPGGEAASWSVWRGHTGQQP